MGTALTISAVNPTNDELTIAGHGLNTGDGAAAIYTPDGGTIPGGLAEVTDYFAIVIDANTLKLASSSANALAGTAIDITSAGSGTLLLLLGIPYRRATTYAAKSQVKSVDLDAMQDNLTVLWNLFTGQTQSVFSKLAPSVPFDSITLNTDKRVILSGAGDVAHGVYTRYLPAAGGAGTMSCTGLVAQASGASQVWLIPIPLLPGDRIKAGGAVFDFEGVGGGTKTLEIISMDYTTIAVTSLASASDASSGSIGQHNCLGADLTLLDGKFYFFRFTAAASGDELWGVKMQWDRP